MTTLKITIITVCYNSLETIRETLSSIAAQTYQNFEHLVIDGASTDGTTELLQSWTAHPIHLISEPDTGIYDAMNKGLSRATGDVIGFLNSDDIYASDSVLAQIAAAFSEGIEACYADLLYVRKKNGRVLRYWSSRAFQLGAFSRGYSPPHPTFYVKREVVQRLGGFDQRYQIAADTEWMMRYLEKGTIQSRYVPHVWVRMRLGGKSNQSVKSIILQNQEVWQALKRNQLDFSVSLFVMIKCINRLRQVVRGLLYQPAL